MAQVGGMVWRRWCHCESFTKDAVDKITYFDNACETHQSEHRHRPSHIDRSQIIKNNKPRNLNFCLQNHFRAAERELRKEKISELIIKAEMGKHVECHSTTTWTFSFPLVNYTQWLQLCQREEQKLLQFIKFLVDTRAFERNFSSLSLNLILFLSRTGDQFVSSLDTKLTQFGCKTSEKYAFVVHGWKESIRTPWVHDMIDNLQRFRGGCTIFMDYSNHSMVQEYFILVSKFEMISLVLVNKLRQLEAHGFNPNKLFMYGFSFGAQLVINAANIYGEQKVAEIDGKACLWLIKNFL